MSLQQKGKDAAAPQEIAANQAKIKGTFSTVAAAAAIGGNATAEKIAENTKKTAKNVQNLADAIREGMLAADNT